MHRKLVGGHIASYKQACALLPAQRVKRTDLFRLAVAVVNISLTNK